MLKNALPVNLQNYLQFLISHDTQTSCLMLDLKIFFSKEKKVNKNMTDELGDCYELP